VKEGVIRNHMILSDGTIRVAPRLTVVGNFCHGLAQIFTDFEFQSVEIREICG
jgi:hypothetical protein